MALLVDIAETIADNLEAARQADTFSRDDFDVAWDFEGRNPLIELSDSDLHVFVFVPFKFEQTGRHDRTKMEFVASCDVIVRQKLGITGQPGAQLAKADITALVVLLEEIHIWFRDNARWEGDLDVEWIDDREEYKARSEIVAAYDPFYLNNHRQYYGVMREVLKIVQ